MHIHLGRRFWIAATAVIVVFTLFVVARNALHAVKIKGQINRLTREELLYREQIERDSTLLEQLHYDDYLEEYAREHYHMQPRDDHAICGGEQVCVPSQTDGGTGFSGPPFCLVACFFQDSSPRSIFAR